MNVPTPGVLPVLRSSGQGRILSAVLLNDCEMSLADIANRAEVDLPCVQREINRLADAGLLTTHQCGDLHLVSPADNEAARSLADLVDITYGPVPMLREFLDDMDQVSEAYLFGPYARRYVGSSANVSNDIDVLVVTDDYPAYDDALERVGALRGRLGKEITLHQALPQEWNQTPPPQGFLAAVKESPLVTLKAAS